jgi:hypothetical protein
MRADSVGRCSISEAVLFSCARFNDCERMYLCIQWGVFSEVYTLHRAKLPGGYTPIAKAVDVKHTHWPTVLSPIPQLHELAASINTEV